MASVKSKALVFAWSQIKSLRKEFTIYLVVAALFAGLSLLPAQLLHLFTIRVSDLNSGGLNAFLFSIAALGAAIAVGLTIASFGKIFVREWLKLQLETHLRLNLIDRFQSLPLERLEGAQRGDWLAKISSDIRNAEEILGTTLPEFLYYFLLVTGSTVLLFYYSGSMAFLLLGAAMLLGFVNYRIQSRLGPLLQEMRGLYGGLLQILIENLEGWQTLRSCEAGAFERRRVENKLDSFCGKGMVAARLIGQSLSSGDFVTHALIAVCLLALGYRVAGRQISPSDSLFYPFYLSMFFYAAKGLVMSGNEWVHYRVSGERLYEIYSSGKANEIALGESGALGASGPYAVEIQNLGVSVGEGKTLFDSISLRLKQGQIVALTGPSGSGKSTLLEVLAGLRTADRGDAKISSGGKPVWSVSSTGGLRLPVPHFSYVEQKPYIFEGSLRANLTLGRPGFSDATLREVLAKVSLKDTFESRGGLEMNLTDRGQNISEGQLYRIALARVLLLKRPFLLLDEPFAALDERTASILVETLHELRAEMGILIVTHYVPNELELDERRSLQSLGTKALALKLDFPLVSEQPGLGVPGVA